MTQQLWPDLFWGHEQMLDSNCGTVIKLQLNLEA